MSRAFAAVAYPFRGAQKAGQGMGCSNGGARGWGTQRAGQGDRGAQRSRQGVKGGWGKVKIDTFLLLMKGWSCLTFRLVTT